MKVFITEDLTCHEIFPRLRGTGPCSPTPISPTPVSPTLGQKVAFRLLVKNIKIGIKATS